MILRLYVPVFALTLLLSAALLFFVQPMFSKMILPLLGGSPQVWNTAMLFFQVALLAGYAYAHGTSRLLGVRTQSLLHIFLLLCFIAVLPLTLPEGAIPPAEQDPTLWQLSVMALSVGGPFFVLAASAPMFQRWFAVSDHRDAHNPYFLYGASNLGSVSALLAYPVLAEPLLNLSQQSNLWMFGYFALIICAVCSALMVWPKASFFNHVHAHLNNNAQPVTWRQRAEWIVLAFIPSSLMLGVTNFITTDIASMPLLWVIPLTLYIGTFILVFSRKTFVSNDILAIVQGVLLALFALSLFATKPAHSFSIIFLHLLLFFVSAWMCHSLLVSKKPHAAHLTEFYLLMSLGGALGGFFNAIIAPQIFTYVWEYPLVLVASAFCRFGGQRTPLFPDERRKNLLYYAGVVCFAVILACFYLWGTHSKVLSPILGLGCFFVLVFYINTRWIFAVLVACLVLVHPPGLALGPSVDILDSSRNFFGVLKVVDSRKPPIRMLMHGTTNHGIQSTDPQYRLERLSYYSKFSPLADVFSYFDARDGQQKVSVLGLGTAATACYTKEGRFFDFFEIDPDVVKIAEDPKYFTYLSDCGSPYQIILGDARLKISEQLDHTYDLIILDVFSSDNIPIHLLTAEAIRIYQSKLKNNGVLLFHISNNYLDLEPVLAATAQMIDVPSFARVTGGGKIEGIGLPYYPSHWVIMSSADDFLSYLRDQKWSESLTSPSIRSWSDHYSNILSVIGNKTIEKRIEILKEEKRARDKMQQEVH
ncbi:MAG: fused MFS/spermidine synthase [Alphaproteobacteria bacterium]|nr:fused MFS/spermidine synthase [Alphaproteobacteria bacterium]